MVEVTASGDADEVEARLREALDGTHVGYLDPRELADRYALDGHQQTLEQQTAVLTQLAAAAAG